MSEATREQVTRALFNACHEELGDCRHWDDGDVLIDDEQRARWSGQVTDWFLAALADAGIVCVEMEKLQAKLAPLPTTRATTENQSSRKTLPPPGPPRPLRGK